MGSGSALERYFKRLPSNSGSLSAINTSNGVESSNKGNELANSIREVHSLYNQKQKRKPPRSNPAVKLLITVPSVVSQERGGEPSDENLGHGSPAANLEIHEIVDFSTIDKLDGTMQVISYS
jgi:hypothetical protein